MSAAGELNATLLAESILMAASIGLELGPEFDLSIECRVAALYYAVGINCGSCPKMWEWGPCACPKAAVRAQRQEELKQVMGRYSEKLREPEGSVQ